MSCHYICLSTLWPEILTKYNFQFTEFQKLHFLLHTPHGPRYQWSLYNHLGGPMQSGPYSHSHTHPFPLSSNLLLLSPFLHPHQFSFFNINIYLLFFIFIYLYLFLAVLGLRFCARVFSSCGERGPLFIAVHGPLTVAASLVVEHKLQTHRLSSCGSWA